MHTHTHAHTHTLTHITTTQQLLWRGDMRRTQRVDGIGGPDAVVLKMEQWKLQVTAQTYKKTYHVQYEKFQTDAMASSAKKRGEVDLPQHLPRHVQAGGPRGSSIAPLGSAPVIQGAA